MYYKYNSNNLYVFSLRVDTEEWIATVEVLLSKSSEACQWMVQYLVAPEGREIIKWASYLSSSAHTMAIELALASKHFSHSITDEWNLTIY